MSEEGVPVSTKHPRLCIFADASVRTMLTYSAALSSLPPAPFFSLLPLPSSSPFKL